MLYYSMKYLLIFLIWIISLSIFGKNASPSTPILITLFDNAKVSDTLPTLEFSSTDPDGDSIEDMVYWDTLSTFATPESALTSTYASGDTASYTFGTPLIDGKTYYWKVKARDPSGSNLWGNFSSARSFTIDTGLPTNTCSWFQIKQAQFSNNTFRGAAQIQGDSIVLAPSDEDTLLNEDFEDGVLPTGWTSVDGGGNTVVWDVGDSATYPPPNYGVYYAEIIYPTTGRRPPGDTDYLVSPSKWIYSQADTLILSYGWGMNYFDSETLSTYVRFHDGTSWGVWNSVSIHSIDGSGADTIDLSTYLPADSVQVRWGFYSDGGPNSQNGAVDNVFLKTVNLSGTMVGTPIVFSDLAYVDSRTSWGKIIWNKSLATDSISVQVEYLLAGVWVLIPDTDLSGNSGEFFTTSASGTLSIDALSTTTYDTIRIIGNLYRSPAKASSDPSLLSWEVGNLSGHTAIYPYPVIVHGGLTYGFKVSGSNLVSKGIRIIYTVPEKVNVGIQVYDITGRMVSDLFSGEKQKGRYTVRWNGTNRNGIYFIRFEAGKYKKTERIVIIK